MLNIVWVLFKKSSGFHIFPLANAAPSNGMNAPVPAFYYRIKDFLLVSLHSAGVDIGNREHFGHGPNTPIPLGLHIQVFFRFLAEPRLHQWSIRSAGG
jgi:hypothetical protein